MPPRPKSTLASSVLIVLATTALLTNACHGGGQHGEGDFKMEPAGEPEQYSATVVRIVEDGSTRETSISREARSGEHRRQDWNEAGQNRALIWMPDLGKGFLLDLDRRTYVEVDISDRRLGASQDGPPNPRDAPAAPDPAVPAGDAAVQAIDQYFGDTPPTRIETRALESAVIDGHPCAVYEQRAIFPDGHAETTRRFLARDLSRLVIKVEGEAEPGTPRVITERRDIRTDVPPDAFIVPADFKRVEKLDN